MPIAPVTAPKSTRPFQRKFRGNTFNTRCINELHLSPEVKEAALTLLNAANADSASLPHTMDGLSFAVHNSVDNAKTIQQLSRETLPWLLEQLELLRRQQRGA